VKLTTQKPAEFNSGCSLISNPVYDLKARTRTNLHLLFLVESCHWSSRRRVL